MSGLEHRYRRSRYPETFTRVIVQGEFGVLVGGDSEFVAQADIGAAMRALPGAFAPITISDDV